jgi:hypothetical protein
MMMMMSECIVRRELFFAVLELVNVVLLFWKGDNERRESGWVVDTGD